MYFTNSEEKFNQLVGLAQTANMSLEQIVKVGRVEDINQLAVKNGLEPLFKEIPSSRKYWLAIRTFVHEWVWVQKIHHLVTVEQICPDFWKLFFEDTRREIPWDRTVMDVVREILFVNMSVTHWLELDNPLRDLMGQVDASPRMSVSWQRVLIESVIKNLFGDLYNRFAYYPDENPFFTFVDFMDVRVSVQ